MWGGLEGIYTFDFSIPERILQLGEGRPVRPQHPRRGEQPLVDAGALPIVVVIADEEDRPGVHAIRDEEICTHRFVERVVLHDVPHGDRFNPEVGFLQRRAYRRVESRYALTYQPKRWPSIRRLASSLNYNVYLDLDNRLESSFGHWHVFEIQPRQGGRIAYIMDFQQDRPRRPFTVYQDVTGRRVVIPPGEYASVNGGLEYDSDPSAPVNLSLRTKNGIFYGGKHYGWEVLVGVRMGARLISSAGWNRDDIKLPVGGFKNDLVPMNISYSFTSLASVLGLIQYNRQTSTLSSNIRLALLNRSGTGLFVVYNDRRDTSDFTSEELLGRSFIVKYTRLVDF